MKRLFFLLLLLAFGCADNEIKCQVTSVMATTTEKVFVDVEASLVGINTTSDGKQPFLLVADSKGAYSTDTDRASPSPTTGTAYQYDAVTTFSVIALTSTDLVNAGQAGANRGSPAPQFCITYNSLTGYKPVIIDAHRYGSYYYNSGGSTVSWDTNGNLYDTAVNRAGDCLNRLGLTKLKGIIVTLGANDASSAITDALTNAGIKSLYDRLASSFPGVPIYYTMLGITNSTPAAKIRAVKNTMLDIQSTYGNSFYAVNESYLNSLGIYGADNLHWTQAGNNLVGETLGYFIANQNRESDKDARRILYGFDTPVNATKAAAIRAYITAEKANGNWYYTDCQQFYVADTENNALYDWAGLTSAKNTASATFSANNYYSSNGTSTYLSPYFNVSGTCKYCAQDDIIIGISTGTNSTSAGTLATAYGSSGGNSCFLTQNASNQTTFSVNSNTGDSYTTDTKIQDNTNYAIRRTSSTSVDLIKAGSVVQNRTRSSTGESSTLWFVGARTSGNQFINCQFKEFYVAKQSTFNISSHNTNATTLKAALAVP